MESEHGTGIDFVVAWVDGSDPAWLREKAAWSGGDSGGDILAADGRDVRYRDYGLLRYWFRGVERFAPWVRRIHFVTWGHMPPWLNTGHPKLRVVRHGDFIPKEFLPTFNANAIELNLHRIEGLSERFVYFNDDMFLLAPARETDFFRNGMPCDLLAFQPVISIPEDPVFSCMLLNNALTVSRHFGKRENVRKQPWSYFRIGYSPLHFFYNLVDLAFARYTGMYDSHGPASFRKEAFRELWEKEERLLRETSSHRFRSRDDVTDYLVRDWQKLTGNFHARNIRKDLTYFAISEDNRRLCQTIERQRKKIICINDGNEGIDFDRAMDELRSAFDTILPERSGFEKAAPGG